jgi:hypothetical protein
MSVACGLVEGMPKITEGTDAVDPGLSILASLDQVKANFRKFYLLDDEVQFIKGWFVD